MLPPKIYVHICSLNILAHFLTKVTGLQQYFYQRFLQKVIVIACSISVSSHDCTQIFDSQMMRAVFVILSACSPLSYRKFILLMMRIRGCQLLISA